MSDYNFKDAVCIDAPVIYDSCADRDCLEDLLVHFSTTDQALINCAQSVRLRNIEVDFVCVDLEPILYQEGFYSVDITFIFDITVDVCSANSASRTLTGEATFNKKVVLCGSEGDVKVFSSDLTLDDYDDQNIPSTNLPKATVQVATPVGLDARLCCGKECHESCCTELPACLCNRKVSKAISRKDSDSETATSTSAAASRNQKCVLVTIGVFSIVQLQRNVQLMIPAGDFCIPTKECVASTDDPCTMFNRIDFPVDEFFPPQCDSSSSSCGCD